MAGHYVSITQDMVDADGMRDYGNESIGSPMTGRQGKMIIVGRTHGCDCCSSDEIVTLEDIDGHIEDLKAELVKAELVRKILLAQETH